MVRLLLRGLAWALAIVALLSPFAGSVDLLSALVGVALGLAIGELAVRRAVRSRWVALGAFAACLVGPLVAGALTDTFLARLLGPGLALSLAGWAVFGVVATSLVAAFRSLGARHDTARGVEAVLLGAAGASVFASHRDGAVGRPLAVADLAWTLGMDPRTLLFGIGGATALMLLALLAAEHEGRIRRTALLIVPVVLALGWLLVGLAGVTPPPDVQTKPTSSEEDGELPRAAPSKPPVDVPPQDGGGAPTEGPTGGDDGATTPKPEDAAEGEAGAPGPEPTPASPQDAGGETPASPTEPGGAPPLPSTQPGGETPAPSKPASEGGQAEPSAGARPGQADRPDGANARPESRGPQGAAKPVGEDAAQDGAADATPDAADAAADAADADAPPPPSGDASPRPGSEDGRAGQGDAGATPKDAKDAKDAKSQDGSPPSEPPDPPQATPPPETKPPEDGEGSGASPDEPRESGGAGQNAQPVAVLLLDDDFEPPTELWYLRQGALSVFNGHRLIPAAPGSGLDGDLIGALPTAPVGSEAPPPMDVRFQLTGSVAILVDHPLPFAPDFPLSYAPLPNPDPSRFLRAWSFSSAVNPLGFEGMLGHTSSGPNVTPELRQTYLTAPIDPRYRQLADEILADLSASAAADPLARALAVKRWLDDHMVGDSARRHEGEGDPTADFLFGDLHGYCVHGAHASVYLDRLLGVPSRIGTGYAVPASDRRGSSLVVRGHQAHAWPEIWLDGLGWVAVDPTPREIVDPPAPPLDEDVARQLGELARQTPPEAEIPPTPRDWLRELMPSLRSVAVGLWTLLRSLAAAAVVGVYLAKVWFALCPWWLQAALPRVAYRAALHRLTSVGLGRQVGESRERHARRVAAVAPSMGALTDAHVAWALGPERDTPVDAATWRAWVRAVRRESAAAVPWWRRALGWIDPSTPFRTR
jgi:transglutaminase-like putative cysteine protease